MTQRIPTRGGLRRYADGGTVGKDKRNPGFIPAPQAQKESMTKEAGTDSRGAIGSKEWYENYGSGPEHLFLGDRRLPTVGPFAQQPGLPPNTQGAPSGGIGDYIPLLGMGAVVGKDLWDWYKNKKGGTLDPELAKQVESGAIDTSTLNSLIKNDLDTLGERLPMPYTYGDGSVGYIGGSDRFWDSMDSEARDTSDIAAWNERQLNEYGQNMEMPNLQIDPSLWDRLGQGAGGAFDLYMGSQQGGLEGTANMVSGAGDLYGSIAGPNIYSDYLGQTGQGLSGAADIYSGIQQGGVEGYTQATQGALDTASSLGYNTGSGALGAVGKAMPYIAAATGAYNTYEAAKVGDKKSAAMQGAATGAAIGSIIPGIGTVVGAVVGAIVGVIGASFGNKDNPSELAYGAHKKMDSKANTRGWTEDQINGAVFETIKSHTKSGGINKFQDVSEMYTAMGITKDAHKNVKQVEGKMGDFIKGVIETAQGVGALPTDPAALRQLDGQEIFHKIITPAMAAKFKEVTGKDSQGWTQDRSDGSSYMHNLMADWTDWMVANWQKAAPPAPQSSSSLGGGRIGGGHVLERKRGGLARYNEGGMVPKRGGLSMANRPTLGESRSYYRYGMQPGQPPGQTPQQPMPNPRGQQPPANPGMPARPMPPMMQRAMGGLAMYGFSSGGSQKLVRGPGTGRSDDIPAVLSDGEYVMDAETVALLGDGSTDEGARRLDELRKKLRMHKGKQLSRGQFSSAAKNPEEYL
jgi:hypothetical protein